MSLRQKNWGLGGLLVAWIALLTVRVLSATEPQHVPLRFASSPAGTTTATESATRLPGTAESRQQPMAPSQPAQYKNIFQPLPLMLGAEKSAEANVAQRVRHRDVRL